MTRLLLATALLLMALRVDSKVHQNNLRRFEVSGYGGSLLFDEDCLQKEVQVRLDAGDPNFPMTLEVPDPAKSHYVMMYLSKVTDLTLKDEGVTGVPNEFSEVSFVLPVQVDGQPGDLQLAHFTDVKKVLNPYLVNYKEEKLLDAIQIEYGDDKDVYTLVKGEDSMTIEVSESSVSKRAAIDIHRKRQENSLKVKTDYPQPLDWGCSQMSATKASFCDVLEIFQFGDGNVDRNVCNADRVISSSDDGKSYHMRITSATNYFEDEIPFIFCRAFPLETDFGFNGTVTESVGFVYPCAECY